LWGTTTRLSSGNCGTSIPQRNSYDIELKTHKHILYKSGFFPDCFLSAERQALGPLVGGKFHPQIINFTDATTGTCMNGNKFKQIIYLFLNLLSLSPVSQDFMSIFQIPALCNPALFNFGSTSLLDKDKCDSIVGYLSVYRVCFGMACFFFLFTLIMINVKTSNDPRSKIQNG
jgi:hypothetical protein